MSTEQGSEQATPAPSLVEELLTAPPERLVKIFYHVAANEDDSDQPSHSQRVARRLGLNHAQLVCALGFNANIRGLGDIVNVLGYENYDALANERNRYFTSDVYENLGIRDILRIYQHVGDNILHLDVMQYLLATRLNNIEERIESTVNSSVIERYRREMHSVYHDGIAQIDFAEERLARKHNGYRALIGEAVLVAESRLIPLGDLFFRDGILPEEKRRLITKGLVPRELIEARLEDQEISTAEADVLRDELMKA